MTIKPFTKAGIAASIAALSFAPAQAQDVGTSPVMQDPCPTTYEAGVVTLDCLASIRNETLRVASAYRAAAAVMISDWASEPAKISCTAALSNFKDEFTNNTYLSGGEILKFTRGIDTCLSDIAAASALGVRAESVTPKVLFDLSNKNLCQLWAIENFRTGVSACSQHDTVAVNTPDVTWQKLAM